MMGGGSANPRVFLPHCVFSCRCSNGSLASYAALIKLLWSSLLLALLLSFTHPTGCGGGEPLFLVFQQQPTYPIPAWAGGWGCRLFIGRITCIISLPSNNIPQPSPTVRYLLLLLSNPARLTLSKTIISNIIEFQV